MVTCGEWFNVSERFIEVLMKAKRIMMKPELMNC